MSLIGSVPVNLARKYIQVLMRDEFSRHELVNVLCSWCGHVSSWRSLEISFERSELEKRMSREDDRPAKHKSIPVGLGISDLDPSTLTLTCLPSLPLSRTKAVGVGSISARKRIALCEARCFKSRSMNNKISANTATTPPTIGPRND